MIFGCTIPPRLIGTGYKHAVIFILFASSNAETYVFCVQVAGANWTAGWYTGPGTGYWSSTTIKGVLVKHNSDLLLELSESYVGHRETT
jgi:hypothetical protein